MKTKFIIKTTVNSIKITPYPDAEILITNFGSDKFLVVSHDILMPIKYPTII